MAKFKNKSERNAGYVTDAMKIFGGKTMLNERPEGMPSDEYRILRKIQTEVLKQLFGKGHKPSRKLQGCMGNQEPIARTTKGLRRVIKQRKSG